MGTFLKKGELVRIAYSAFGWTERKDLKDHGYSGRRVSFYPQILPGIPLSPESALEYEMMLFLSHQPGTIL